MRDGPDAAMTGQGGSQLPATTAAASCSPVSQISSWGAAESEDQLSHRAQFCTNLSTQEWGLIPPLLLLPHKIQRGCGLLTASTGEDPPNARVNPALLSTLWALAQLNHHFHTIKPKNSKHTIKTFL